MARVIDPSWVELQTGLYLEEYTKTIGGTEYTFRNLHSSEGYCFYDSTLSEENRIYAQDIGLAISLSTWTYEQINARYISVPIEDWMEIVSTSNPPVEI